MADLTATLVADPVADAPIEAPDTIEAPTDGDATSDALFAEPAEPIVTDDTDAALESPDGTDAEDVDLDKPITRKNKDQLVQEARDAAIKAMEERDAELQRAADLEASIKQQEAKRTEFDQRVFEWIGPQEEYAALLKEVQAPIPDVDANYATTDELNAQQEAIRKRNAALDKLGAYSERRELIPHMTEMARSDFLNRAGSAFVKTVESHEGVDKAVVIDALTGDMKPDEFTKRFGDALDHIYQAGKQAAESEWKPKYAALDRANKTLKAANGGPVDAPVSGGRAGGSRVFTRADLAGPEGLKLYREHRAEIERQEAEGLIR